MKKNISMIFCFLLVFSLVACGNLTTSSENTSELLNNEIDKLKKEINTLKEEIDALNEKVNTLNEKINVQNDNIETSNKETNSLDVDIDYGISSIYTKEDMDEAIDIILKQFNSFDGCELHSLSYMPDEECNNFDNISWMNDLEEANDNEEIFTQCIAFNSSFHSPKEGDGVWIEDEEYTWSWWLARSEGREWKLMTWGY